MNRFVSALLVLAIVMSIAAFVHTVHTDGWLDGYGECRAVYR